MMEGNIFLDTEFVDLDDFHLQDSSPCIGAGIDEILVAGESGAITLLTLTFTDNLGGDGKVNFQNFAELTNYWQQNEPSADIGPWPIGDGVVNIIDLAVLVEDWLQTAYWVE